VLRGGVGDRRAPVQRDDHPRAADHRGELGDREVPRLAPGHRDLELLRDPRVLALLADRERLGLDREAAGRWIAEIAHELGGDRVSPFGDLAGIDAERERRRGQQAGERLDVGLRDRGALGCDQVLYGVGRLARDATATSRRRRPEAWTRRSRSRRRRCLHRSGL